MRLTFTEEHDFWGMGIMKTPRPMVPVTLIGKRGLEAQTYALLDSGADITMFHSKWAHKIGLDLYSGRLENIGGIAGGVDCYCHRIRLRIGSFEVRCEVAFSDQLSQEPEDQLVGREDVFSSMKFGLRQGIGKLYIGHPP